MSQSSSTGGIGFLGLLGILFIGLKLGHIIEWSWWLVLLPIYGPLVALPIFVVSLLGIVTVLGILQKKH